MSSNIGMQMTLGQNVLLMLPHLCLLPVLSCLSSGTICIERSCSSVFRNLIYQLFTFHLPQKTAMCLYFHQLPTRLRPNLPSLHHQISLSDTCVELSFQLYKPLKMHTFFFFRSSLYSRSLINAFVIFHIHQCLKNLSLLLQTTLKPDCNNDACPNSDNKLFLAHLTWRDLQLEKR